MANNSFLQGESKTIDYITSLGKEKGIYIRVAGTSRPAGKLRLKELEFEGSNRYFDQTYAAGREVTEEEVRDLCVRMNETAVRRCLTEEEKRNLRTITKQNLISWGFLVEQEGKLLPTNAFVLFTENDFPQAKIQCGVFKGSTRNIFVDKREYTGPIFQQLEEVYQYILRNIRLGAEIEGLYRVDRYELPIGVIRELICNAVIHRSYLDEGCIQVLLFDDRLEVTSPGMLFADLTIESMKSGQSRPRNRAISTAFAAMKLIEQWGTGIPKILSECKNYGIKEPEFVELGADFRVNVYRNIPDNLIGDFHQPYQTEEDKVISYLRTYHMISPLEAMEVCGFKARGEGYKVLNRMFKKGIIRSNGIGQEITYSL